MSDALYATRLRWWDGKGIAKLHGRTVALAEAPALSTTGPVDGLDYCPEVRVVRVMPRFCGWRDMEGPEINECDALLHRLCGGQS